MLILGNILVGVGLSAATFGPVLGVILRVAPPEKQALAVGICSAGGSFGQFFIVPLAAVLQHHFGDWRPTMWALTIIAGLMILLPIGLNDSREIAAGRRAGGGRQTAGEALSEAFAQRSYVLLVVGYFVCGFHVAFVGGHLPAYISDKGIGPVAVRHQPVAGRARRLGDRHGRPVQHRGRHPVERDGQPLQAQEPPVAALPPALAGVPGLRAGAAVGRLGADLRRRRWASCGSAPCRSPPPWSATSSGRSISPC